MNIISNLLVRLDIHYREKLNKYFGPFRRLFLNNNSFTIFSNNCWAGHVYRYFNLPYKTPTIGLYFMPQDYLKFLSDPMKYLSMDLKFINYNSSKYSDYLKNHDSTNCPIGVLDDIEIVFLHYKTEAEAYEKWNRRKQRIDWDNIFVKMSEQNMCNEAILKQFDQLPYDHKFVFTHKDYGLNSQIIFRDFIFSDSVLNDTQRFRRYINLTSWLNCCTNFKKR